MFLEIKEGRHRCNRWLPKFTFKDIIIGKVTFLGDFSYDIGAKHQKDSNKVIGLSNGFWHRWSSIRVGWRWNKTLNSLEVVGICYNRGKREIKRIKLVKENKEYSFTIHISKDYYTILFDDQVVTFENKSKWRFLRYYLFPYFGGRKKATKDFKFNIKIF